MSRNQPLADVVLGVTAFNRPRLLERLIKSVREFYPALPILVADNGWMPADLEQFDGVTTVHVERDCGLSASRNALARACPTEFMVLAEEDFVFTDKTDLAAAHAILAPDESLGMVGGSLVADRQVQHYARNFRRETRPEGDVLLAYPAGGPVKRLTTGGRSIPWRRCEMVFNWGMIRRDLMIELPWDENLKLAEHVDWFLRIQNETGWTIAHTPALQARHDREEPGDYQQHRQRAAGFLELFRQKHELQRFEHTPATREPIQASRSVVVMGVGHSGTSIVSKMLQALGWYGGPADEEYGEHPGVRDVNEAGWRSHDIDLSAAFDHLDDLAGPWVIKDPRFVHTLDLWLPILGRHKPTLVWVVRDAQRVAASYVSREESTRDGLTVEELERMAKKQFDAWPWGKVRVDYENIADAIGLFDLVRAGGGDGATDPVPPQAEPRKVPSPVYDGEPGGPCVCDVPGDCRRHPAIHKVGRLFDICRGDVLTPTKCEEYRRAWDDQAAGLQVVTKSKKLNTNDDPMGCVHRGEYLEKCGAG